MKPRIEITPNHPTAGYYYCRVKVAATKYEQELVTNHLQEVETWLEEQEILPGPAEDGEDKPATAAPFGQGGAR